FDNVTIEEELVADLATFETLNVLGTATINNLMATTATIGTLIVGCNLTVGCNILMKDSSSSAIGNILKAGTRFVHNYGTDNTFIGKGAGNFTLTGSEIV